MMGAQMYLQMEQMDKAYLFLQLATRHYPKSEEAHRNLAEYYLQIKEKDQAIAALKKAYDLSGKEEYHQQIERLKAPNE